MAAIESVKVAAVARDHARASMNRLEVFIANNNVRGITREVNFLNALNKNAVKQAARATGIAASQAHAGLGTRALINYQNPIKSGIARSALLAEFSDDIMRASRDTEARFGKAGEWVWTANNSACAACLAEHGKVHHGPMTPMHPSCLCIPDAAGLARPLTDDELGDLMYARGGRDRQMAEWLRSGDLSRNQLFRSIGGKQNVQRNYGPGFANAAPKHKWTKNEIQLLDDLGPAAKKPQVVKAFRKEYPEFTGSDQSIWAKHQRTHDLLGKKKKATIGKTKPGYQQIKNAPSASFGEAPAGVKVKKVDTIVGNNMKRTELWDNGTSVYKVNTGSSSDALKMLQNRYGVDNVKVVTMQNSGDGSYRVVLRHLDVEKQIKAGKQGKLLTDSPKPKVTAAKSKAAIKAEPPVAPPPVSEIPLPKARLFKDATYDISDVIDPHIVLADGTKIRYIEKYTGDVVQFPDEAIDLLKKMDANSILKNTGVKEIQLQRGAIPGRPTASGLYHNGKITVRLDAPGADVAHTFRHELGHAFRETKQGRAIIVDHDAAMRELFRSWDTLDDTVKAAYNYPYSKWVSGNTSEAMHEAYADTFSFFMNGQRGLINALSPDIDELFADATRRLQYVPIRRTGGKRRVTEWLLKDEDVRAATPNFAKLERSSSEWVRSLTYEERNIVRTYSGSWASTVNSSIATGKAGPNNAKVKLLNRALKKHSPKEPVLTWRTVPSRVSGKVQMELDRALKSGGRFTHKPFGSSTTIPGSYSSIRAQPYVLEIKSKSGAFIRELSGFKGENEYLIPAFTDYKVVGKKVVKFQVSSGRTFTQTVYQIEEI